MYNSCIKLKLLSNLSRGLCEKLAKSFRWSSFYPRWIATYPVDRVIRSLNNWGLQVHKTRSVYKGLLPNTGIYLFSNHTHVGKYLYGKDVLPTQYFLRYLNNKVFLSRGYRTDSYPVES